MAYLPPRLGGPLGRHAGTSGFWLNATTLAVAVGLLTWTILALRQRLCAPYDPAQAIHWYARGCYSDIPLLYSSSIAHGNVPYLNTGFNEPILIGLFVIVVSIATVAFGGHATSDPASVIEAAHTFTTIASVLLGACFLVLVVAHLFIGRDPKTRSGDAILVAIAPPIVLSGLIGWHVLPAMFVSVALWAWSRNRVWLSGTLFGLACASGTYSALIVIGIVALCVRERRILVGAKLAALTLSSWFLANLPAMLINLDLWLSGWRALSSQNAGYGSAWFVFNLAGANLKGVYWLAFWLVLFAMVALVRWIVVSNVRPRVGQVAFLAVAALVLFAPSVAPQDSIWLWPLLVLARPCRGDLVAFAIADVIYVVAIWAFLGGPLNPDTFGPHRLYWAAVALRLGTIAVISVRIIWDVAQPWRDRLRLPDVTDPIAGPLGRQRFGRS